MVDKKISELDSASTLNGNEETELLQVGNNVRATLTAIKNWIAGVITFDYITLDTDPPVVTSEGTILWNKYEYTIEVVTGLGATIQVGQEILMLYYNDTGSIIANGSILHPKSGTVVSGYVFPTPELADASSWELVQGTLSISTHAIGIGELGLATRFGRVREVDTSGVASGAQLWLSDTNPGEFTDVKPSFPLSVLAESNSLIFSSKESLSSYPAPSMTSSSSISPTLCSASSSANCSTL